MRNKVKQAHSRAKAPEVNSRSALFAPDVAQLPNAVMLISITLALVLTSNQYKLYKARLDSIKYCHCTACLTTPHLSHASCEDNTPGIQVLTLLINPMPCCISARLWRFAPVVSNVLCSLINSAEPLNCSTFRSILLLIAGTKRGVHSLQVQEVTSTTLLTALSRTLFQAPAATALLSLIFPKSMKSQLHVNYLTSAL